MLFLRRNGRWAAIFLLGIWVVACGTANNPAPENETDILSVIDGNILPDDDMLFPDDVSDDLEQDDVLAGDDITDIDGLSPVDDDPPLNVSWHVLAGGDWFEGRSDPLLVSYFNSLWLIGGVGVDGYLEDVWHSSDGMSWHLAAADMWTGTIPAILPEVTLQGYSVTVHNNDLYLVNGTSYAPPPYVGLDKYLFKAESNGLSISFQPVVNAGELPFAPTTRPAFFSFLGSMWVLNNYDPTGVPRSVLYRSVDGVAWEEAARDMFAPRSGAAPVVFDERAWLFGSIESATSREVWVSDDGETWELVANDAPFSGGGMLGTIFDGQMLLAPRQGSDTLLASVDGEHWAPIAGPEGGVPTGSGLAAFNDRLFIVAGEQKSMVHYAGSNLVWYSMEQNTASFTGRSLHAVADLESHFYVVGGRNWEIENKKNVMLDDVWRSSDGVNWELLSEMSAFGPRAGHSLTAFNDELVLIGGMDGEASNDVWRSTDGVEWTRTTDNAAFPPRQGHGAVVWQGQLCLLGGFDIDGDAGNDVWCSADGVDFSPLEVVVPFSVRALHAAFVFDDALWVVGGQITRFSSFECRNDVWRSADGIHWEEVVRHASFEPRYGAVAQPVNGGLWLYGGYSYTGGSFSDLWYSRDGAMWYPAAQSPVEMQGRWGQVSAVRGAQWYLFGGRYQKLSYEDFGDVRVAEIPLIPVDQ